ncbi:amidase signature enzyme [Ceratobasidium sp. AG-I]|nr:amidase signature enzyme [Ceratobasidium sp. AG-I]
MMEKHEALALVQRTSRCWLLTVILLLSITLSFISNGIPRRGVGAGAPKYPDLYEASIAELQSGLDNHQFTSVDLVKAYLARIKEVNLKGPKLHAVIEVNPSALKQAAALDNERKKSGRRSPLHGIPILLKDNMATLASEGMNTTAGSYALLGSVVPGDSTVSAKLRKAGAILLGKTNMSEWAHFRGYLDAGWSGRGGQTTNPYYPGASACTSSSGSGVAAAIGLAAASLGTETDSSIICPASYNNLVGFKPTVGLTSRYGVIPISSHHDTIGPMVKSVADAATILSIIAGRDSKDNYTQTAPGIIPDYTKYLDANAIRGKRFGVPRTVFTDDTFTGNNPYINVAFNRSLETIKALGGIIVDPADLPSANEFKFKTHQTFVSSIDFKIKLNAYLGSLNSIPTGASTLSKIIAFNNAYMDLERPAGNEDQSTLIMSQSTDGYNSTYYAALHADYELGRTNGIDAALRNHRLDALILPSNGRSTTPPAIAGYPMISVPLGFFPSTTPVVREPKSSHVAHIVYPAPGLPFGLSFIGTAYSEPSLIGFAYAYEQSTHTRLQRLAYAEAIPKTQLEDVIGL